MKFELEFYHFHSRKCIWKWLIGRHFVQVEMSLKLNLLCHDDIMRMSWHGNAFHMTDPLWGESCNSQWIPQVDSPHKRPIMENFHVFYVVSSTNSWTNCWVASDLRYHDTHTTSLWCYIKTALCQAGPWMGTMRLHVCRSSLPGPLQYWHLIGVHWEQNYFWPLVVVHLVTISWGLIVDLIISDTMLCTAWHL